MIRSHTSRFIAASLTTILLGSSIIAQTSIAIEVQVSNAPENNLALTLRAISSARKSIFLNIYELSSAEISNALLAQIKAGVQVVILEEGSPVGGMSTTAKGIQSALASAMTAQKSDHFFSMASGSGSRRYRFDHAKYAVIDDEWLLIGSENYSPTGNPQAGSLGNRGWEVFIHDQALAQDYKSVFTTDATTQFGDVSELSRNLESRIPATASPFLPTQNKTVAVNGNTGLSASRITRISSPDSSLNGLLGLIQNARTSLDIEQMTLDSDWNKTPGASPLTAAVIAAAKRGVKVRVLLNDSHVFDHVGHPAAPHNTDTVAILTQAGVDARIANLKAMGVDYIHNKGMLVDGTLTLVSSINWDQNSVEKNREAAVAIESPSVNQYYSQLFNRDWSVSTTRFEMLAVPAAFACPRSLHMKAQIEKLNIQDTEDSDFKSLSDTTVQGDFERDEKISGCVLTQNADDLSLEHRQLIELKPKKDGSVSFSFEGYTPKNHKIYSVRASLKDRSANHSFNAVLYAGSGLRESLGSAKLEVLMQ